MRFSLRKSASRATRTSGLALGVALATSSVIGATAFAEPAYAAKKDKKKKEANSASYSKEFIAAYQPLQELNKAEVKDYAAIKAAFPAMVAATSSPDEKLAAGGMIYNAGVVTKDDDLRLQGVAFMLESGKTAPDQVALMNYVAYELLRGKNRHTEARNYLKAAIDNNFTYEGIAPSDLQVAYATTFFASNDTAGGLNYLLGEIKGQEAAGRPGNETLYKLAVAKAYEAKLVPQVYDVTSQWVAAYPTSTNWRDAINIARNLNRYEVAERLDLLRLGLRLNTLQDKSDYLDYLEAADPRRLPKETLALIDQGYSSGIVDKGDTFFAEARTTAQGRLSADRADLASLDRDANKAGAAVKTVVAAGDTFLSYGQPEKAETFYAKALTMPGSDTALVLTRLGMAQVDQGKYAEAKLTFARVEGARQAIARLWSAYSRQTETRTSPPVPGGTGG